MKAIFGLLFFVAFATFSVLTAPKTHAACADIVSLEDHPTLALIDPTNFICFFEDTSANSASQLTTFRDSSGKGVGDTVQMVDTKTNVESSIYRIYDPYQEVARFSPAIAGFGNASNDKTYRISFTWGSDKVAFQITGYSSKGSVDIHQITKNGKHIYLASAGLASNQKQIWPQPGGQIVTISGTDISHAEDGKISIVFQIYEAAKDAQGNVASKDIDGRKDVSADHSKPIAGAEVVLKIANTGGPELKANTQDAVNAGQPLLSFPTGTVGLTKERAFKADSKGQVKLFVTPTGIQAYSFSAQAPNHEPLTQPTTYAFNAQLAAKDRNFDIVLVPKGSALQGRVFRSADGAPIVDNGSQQTERGSVPPSSADKYGCSLPPLNSEYIAGVVRWVFCELVGSMGDGLNWGINQVAFFAATSNNNPTQGDWRNVAFVLKANDSNASYLHNRWVVDGWKLTTSIASGFVGLLLLIAVFSNILHIDLENWGVRKLLPNIIVATVTASLSLFVIRFIVDVADVLTRGLDSMFAQATPGHLDLGHALGNSFGITQTFKYAEGCKSFTNTLALADANVASIGLGILSFLFMLVAFVLILLIAIQLVIRPAVIYVTTVAAPVVLIGGAFPWFKDWRGKWQKYLTSWVFMAPAIMFVLELASLPGRIGSGTPTTDLSCYAISPDVNLVGAFAAAFLLWYAVRIPSIMGGNIQGSFNKYTQAIPKWAGGNRMADVNKEDRSFTGRVKYFTGRAINLAGSPYAAVHAIKKGNEDAGKLFDKDFNRAVGRNKLYGSPIGGGDRVKATALKEIMKDDVSTMVDSNAVVAHMKKVGVADHLLDYVQRESASRGVPMATVISEVMSESGDIKQKAYARQHNIKDWGQIGRFQEGMRQATNLYRQEQRGRGGGSTRTDEVFNALGGQFSAAEPEAEGLQDKKDSAEEAQNPEAAENQADPENPKYGNSGADHKTPSAPTNNAGTITINAENVHLNSSGQPVQVAPEPNLSEATGTPASEGFSPDDVAALEQIAQLEQEKLNDPTKGSEYDQQIQDLKQHVSHAASTDEAFQQAGGDNPNSSPTTVVPDTTGKATKPPQTEESSAQTTSEPDSSETTGAAAGYSPEQIAVLEKITELEQNKQRDPANGSEYDRQIQDLKESFTQAAAVMPTVAPMPVVPDVTDKAAEPVQEESTASETSEDEAGSSETEAEPADTTAEPEAEIKDVVDEDEAEQVANLPEEFKVLREELAGHFTNLIEQQKQQPSSTATIQASAAGRPNTAKPGAQAFDIPNPAERLRWIRAFMVGRTGQQMLATLTRHPFYKKYASKQMATQNKSLGEMMAQSPSGLQGQDLADYASFKDTLGQFNDVVDNAANMNYKAGLLVNRINKEAGTNFSRSSFVAKLEAGGAAEIGDTIAGRLSDNPLTKSQLLGDVKSFADGPKVGPAAISKEVTRLVQSSGQPPEAQPASAAPTSPAIPNATPFASQPSLSTPAAPSVAPSLPPPTPPATIESPAAPEPPAAVPPPSDSGAAQ